MNKYYMQLMLLLLLNLMRQTIKAQPSSLQLKKLDSALTTAHLKNEFNGVFIIAHQGKTIFEKVLGATNTDGKTLLDIHSGFNLASISKTFTSAMVLILKEQGKLTLDEPVHKHIPNFPYPNITIRHLLTHTHGLPEYFDLAEKNTSKQDTLTNEKLILLLQKVQPKLASEPGSQFSYCNTGYALLASVIEKVTSMPLPKFFEKTITKPLQLNDTRMFTIIMKNSPVNRAYGMKHENNQWVLNDLTRLDGVLGDGSVYSSAEDLLKWDRALSTYQLVSEASMKEAYTPVQVTNTPKFKYGYGWIISKEGKEVSHSGSWMGFKTNFIRDMENQVTIVILTNGTATVALKKAIDIVLDKK
jgi:N-acyl-D-amino-acid deacylase